MCSHDSKACASVESPRAHHVIGLSKPVASRLHEALRVGVGAGALLLQIAQPRLPWRRDDVSIAVQTRVRRTDRERRFATSINVRRQV